MWYAIVTLHSSLAQGAKSRATSSLRALHLENRALLRTLSRATQLRPSRAPALSLSVPGLALCRLASETAWGEVGRMLGGGLALTETSCIISWDDLADTFRGIIKKHYEVTHMQALLG